MNKYKHLFDCIPDEIVATKLLSCFGHQRLRENTFITPSILPVEDTLNKINLLIPQLAINYTLKKAKAYLPVKSVKQSIVILRHFLYYVGYKLEYIRKTRKVNARYELVSFRRHNKKFTVNFDW